MRQYDDLAAEWWRPGGVFVMLQGLAEARAALLPSADRPDAVLVDVGCGGGLLGPHIAAKGYRHVGVDLVDSALRHAAEHGVAPIRADVGRLPIADGCADAVTAGEILEHVTDLPATVAEICRILRPGGRLVLDTLADTVLCRFVAITVCERIGLSQRGIHDPTLLVDPERLTTECARHGVRLTIRGVRPATVPVLRRLIRRRGTVSFVPTWSTAVLFQGVGVKES